MSDVTSFHVTGDWRHLVEDSMLDVDAEPDAAIPTGEVTFTVVSPTVVEAGEPSIGYTFGTITRTLTAGGIDVHLPGIVGDRTLTWRATSRIDYQGIPLPFPVLEFVLGTDIVLTSNELVGGA